MPIRYTHFPRTEEPPEFITELFSIFNFHEDEISTEKGNKLDSDGVLAILRSSLENAGFEVESGKKSTQKIHRPVTFGENGKPDMKYEIDAYHPKHSIGLEVEAGRGYAGNAIYRDLIQGIVMNGVEHLAIAVCNHYHSSGSDDYKKCLNICSALSLQTRVKLPYSITLIGY